MKDNKLKIFLSERGMTKREVEVSALITRGLSNKEIANQLFITDRTVKYHITNIYSKLKLKSRAQLIIYCLPQLDFE